MEIIWGTAASKYGIVFNIDSSVTLFVYTDLYLIIR
jgi:hypothetical protein